MYLGTVGDIPVGYAGLDASLNYRGVDITRLIKARNLEITDKTYGKEGGSAHTNSSALSGTPAVIGGHQYWPTTAQQRVVIATSDGKLYKSSDAGATFSEVTTPSGLGSDKKTVMNEGGKETSGADKKLFIYNGYDAPQVLTADGSATTDITTPSLDWSGNTQPIKGCMHNNRHWAILKDSAYASDPTDHEVFTGGDSFYTPVYPGEGSELTNMCSFLGRLFFFKKPYGIYYLYDDSYTYSQWYPKRITAKVGCCGPDALDYGKNEMFFLSNNGFLHFMSGVQAFGDVRDSDIITLLNINNFIKNDIARDRLDRAVVRYNEEKQTVLVCYTAQGSTRNNRILKLNIEDMSNIKAEITDKDECESAWILDDISTNVGTVQLGGNAGYCWNIDQDTKAVNGSAYIAEFQIPETDFAWLDPRLANKNKLFDFCEIECLPYGNFNISCRVYINGQQSGQTMLFNMGGDAGLLDSFTLDTDQLGGGSTINKMLPMYGTGRTLSLRFYNEGLNQGFKIAKIKVYFRVGSEDLRN